MAVSCSAAAAQQSAASDGGHFFEGAEKLLELWFEKEADGASLRNIPREEIVAMLDIARCHILHQRSNGHVDSYVLRFVCTTIVPS